jgi:putative NIF3 family GTP cyclohydrolase 1 type 2
VPPRASDIVAALFDIAPECLAESWDNVGLLVGYSGAEVRRAVVALDVTEGVLAQAARQSAQLVVAHHPLFLKTRRWGG